MKSIAMSVALVITLTLAQMASAATIDVGALGDNGWVSTDTRINGVNATTPAEIAQRIEFANVAGVGAVQLSSPASSDKATIARVDTATGFGALDSLFTAEYRWYKDSPVGAAAPALKIGLQTSEYVGGPSGRIGEQDWDKVLIYEPYDNPNAATTPVGTWVTQTIDANTGTWWMFSRESTTATGVINAPHNSLTLNDWFTDGTWGNILLNSTIVQIQLGVGSGNPGTVGYVDYLETSALDGGMRNDFVAPAVVPEPSSFVLLGMGAIGLAGYGWRRRKSKP